MDFIHNTFDTLGYFGPNLLLIGSIFLLLDKKTYLYIYLIGFLFNIILNLILKGIIQQPRPEEDRRLFNLEILSGKRIGYDRYGMPSGHAQTVFYSTIFIYLVLKDVRISLLYLFISFLTFCQRIKFNNHTLEQVIVGSFVGSGMGYLVYQYGKNILKGKLSLKMDDNAPI